MSDLQDFDVYDSKLSKYIKKHLSNISKLSTLNPNLKIIQTSMIVSNLIECSKNRGTKPKKERTFRHRWWSLTHIFILVFYAFFFLSVSICLWLYFTVTTFKNWYRCAKHHALLGRNFVEDRHSRYSRRKICSQQICPGLLVISMIFKAIVFENQRVTFIFNCFSSCYR